MSWRAGFFVNVPIGAAMTSPRPGSCPRPAAARGRFDLLGALRATLGVGALVFGIIHAADAGWSRPVTVAALAPASCSWSCSC